MFWLTARAARAIHIDSNQTYQTSTIRACRSNGETEIGVDTEVLFHLNARACWTTANKRRHTWPIRSQWFGWHEWTNSMKHPTNAPTHRSSLHNRNMIDFSVALAIPIRLAVQSYTNIVCILDFVLWIRLPNYPSGGICVRFDKFKEIEKW